MITNDDYFAGYPRDPGITGTHIANATALLEKVSALLDECVQLGWQPRINAATGTMISGQRNGGWRPQNCPIGAAGSSHKQGRGVDVADADGSLDALIDDNMLRRHGLYREHPQATAGWCHLTDRTVGSDARIRTFWP